MEQRPLGMGLETWRGIISILSFVTPIMVMALLFWLQKYFIQRVQYEKQLADDKKARELEKEEQEKLVERARVVYFETKKRIDEIIANVATSTQTALGKITVMEFTMVEYNKQCRELTSEQGHLEGQMRALVEGQNQNERRTQEQIGGMRIEMERIKTMLDERLPKRRD